jgi:ADP-ribose pyrophosphatase YjhB (NUDIX family)
VVKKNTHCSYCGANFLSEDFPKTCHHCNNTTWVNPLPVVVVLVAARNDRGGVGIIKQRRNIEPDKGGWALPGGYIDSNEKWRDAAVREVREEVGLTIDPEHIRLFDVLDSPDSDHIMVFATYEKDPPLFTDISFTPNSEVTEIGLVNTWKEATTDLVWTTHRQVAFEYLMRKLRGV